MFEMYLRAMFTLCVECFGVMMKFALESAGEPLNRNLTSHR